MELDAGIRMSDQKARSVRRKRPIGTTIEAQIVTDIALVQVIRLDWRDNAELIVDPLDHFQIDLCLSARLQGMSVCYPAHWGTRRFVRVGELLLIPPGEKVIARCDFPDVASGQTHASTVIKFDPALVYQWLNNSGRWKSEQLEAALDISDQSIYSLMGRLAREAFGAASGTATSASRTLVELIARQLGIEVGRYFENRTEPDFRGGLATWRLRLIDERTQQIGKPPSVIELAELCRISPRQLQRGFRLSRGCSIGRHIENCRMDSAKRLLQKGEAIGTVASQLGYASQSSFSYAFRRATGATPAQFCKLI
jgi:AraC family transcriptional regulator